MNKRKVTKGKGSKVKPNNHPSEVFVLPPNLLEALGINLGNIETAPECSSGNQISGKCYQILKISIKIFACDI